MGTWILHVGSPSSQLQGECHKHEIKQMYSPTWQRAVAVLEYFCQTTLSGYEIHDYKVQAACRQF